MLGAILASVLHAIALHAGPLTLVQPMMVSGLVFALVFRQLIERRWPAPAQLGWAAALSGGLVLFLLAATPAAGPPQAPDAGPTLLAVIALPASMAVCWVFGRRADGRGSAALLGAGAGFAFAGTAALLKQVTNQVGHGLGAVLGTWPIYALALAGLFGMIFNQLAFRAAALSASLPALSTVDPLVSFFLGVAVFDEPFRSAPVAVVAELMALLVVTASAVALARHQAEDSYRGPTRSYRKGELVAVGAQSGTRG